jgi:hypothetical protein
MKRWMAVVALLVVFFVWVYWWTVPRPGMQYMCGGNGPVPPYPSGLKLNPLWISDSPDCRSLLPK